MTWGEIRAHFIVIYARARAAGTTQQAIAARGGIAGQNSVSRLLSNDRLGPSVEIFVRALEGLGLTPSQFFAELEASATETRPRYGGSSLSDAITPGDPHRLDPQQIHDIVRAATEGLLARLERLDARVAQLGADDGSVPARPSAAPGTHHQRAAGLIDAIDAEEKRA
jgi:transcriptional regulator with XRE-family HTH domain